MPFFFPELAAPRHVHAKNYMCVVFSNQTKLSNLIIELTEQKRENHYELTILLIRPRISAHIKLIEFYCDSSQETSNLRRVLVQPSPTQTWTETAIQKSLPATSRLS